MPSIIMNIFEAMYIINAVIARPYFSAKMQIVLPFWTGFRKHRSLYVQ